MSNLLRRTSIAAAAAVLFAVTAGCTTYYKVTDPSSGKDYYTTSYKTKSGALVFEDDATRSKVNIQNAEIREISKDRYNEAVRP